MSTDGRNLVERMMWDEVARRIDGGAPAILPIGAAAKQHGLHLPLNTDRIQAERLAARLADPIGALIWPTLTYGHYPAFVDYAGSTSLSAPVFEAMVQQIASGILGTAAALCLCSIPASARWRRSRLHWRASAPATRCICGFMTGRTIAAPLPRSPSSATAATPMSWRPR